MRPYFLRQRADGAQNYKREQIVNLIKDEVNRKAVMMEDQQHIIIWQKVRVIASVTLSHLPCTATMLRKSAAGTKRKKNELLHAGRKIRTTLYE